MRSAQRFAAAIFSLTLALTIVLSGSAPAAAAAGFHAAYFSESDFLALAPGQTGQFAVGYANTGDQAWLKGGTGTQANLATGAPLDNTALSSQGWAVGWLTPNRYAAQGAALVAPGQIGFFTYTVRVPNTQPTGVVNFYGRPVIDGVTFLEDYGYYQAVNVVAGQVIITSTTPASPNVNTRPTVNGAGAGNGCTATVFDGTTNVGTGTSDASGNFAIQTSTLASGSHALSASATCPDGSFRASAGAITYTVSSSSTGGTFVSSVSMPNSRTVVINFAQCVQPNSVGATNATAGANDATNPANYAFAPATPITSITMTSGASVTVFLTAPFVSPSGHTVTVSNMQPCSGTVQATPETAAFTFSDTTGPTLVSVASGAASAGATTRVDVTWSEPVQCSGTYTVDGIAATGVVNLNATATGQTICVLTTQALGAGTSHTLAVANERDQGPANAQSPNPTSVGFSVSTNPALTISSSSPQAENRIRVTWSQAINLAGAYTCASPNPTPIACPATLVGTASVDLTLASPFTVSGCNGGGQTTCAIMVSVTGETGPGPAGSTLVESPTPQTTVATITKDTTPPTLVSAAQVGTTQDTFDATWSENVSGPLACVAAGTCAIRIRDNTNAIVASTIANENAGVSLTISACDNLVGDTKTRLTLLANPAAYAPCAAATAALPGGSDTLATAAAALQDLAATPNASTAGSVGLSVVDSTAPTNTGFTAEGGANCPVPPAQCRVFTFTFSERMATSGGGSVLDVTHFRLNGGAVSGLAAVNAAGTVVTLTLTANAPAGSNQFQVSGLTDVAGNPTPPNLFRNFTY